VTEVSFRPRARLLSVLGDQLIRDEVVAVTELVKNAYDADAKLATVELRNVTAGTGSGVITIRDDGIGMAPEVVSEKWLELATSSKTPAETRDEATGRVTVVPRNSPSGRIQLGEKGIGRLAALKLGELMILITRAEEVDSETEVICDVSKLGSISYLDEFKVEVNVREPVVFEGKTHGTLLKMEKLRRPWTEATIRKLEVALRRMATVELETFRIRFVCTDLGIDTQLEPFAISKAPYEIEGNVDGGGLFSGSLRVTNFVGARPIETTRDLHVDLVDRLGETRPKRRERKVEITHPTRVGPFRIRVQAFDLDPAGLRLAGLTVADRDLLRELGGISVIRDRFRVFPYGEKGDDWLELNQRRVNNPTLRFSNNQVVSSVHITRAGNPELRDKTNREGLIENVAYDELRHLVLAVLSILEEARFKVRPRRKGAIREDKVIAAIEKAKGVVAENAKAVTAIEEILGQYSTWSQALEDRNTILLQVAGIGMAAETVTHEIDRDIRLIDSNVKGLLAQFQVGARPELIVQTLDVLSKHIADLREVVTILQPFQVAKKPRDQEQSTEAIVRGVVRLFHVDLSNSNVKASVEVEDDLRLEVSRSDLLQVFMNLIDNAIYWLGNVEDRRLEIRIRGKDKEVLVLDSGPGIRADIADLIFEPFFTRKDQGRGLGLYIVRDIMTRHGWSIDLVPSDEKFPGANFLLSFERKEEREKDGNN